MLNPGTKRRRVLFCNINITLYHLRRRSRDQAATGLGTQVWNKHYPFSYCCGLRASLLFPVSAVDIGFSVQVELPAAASPSLPLNLVRGWKIATKPGSSALAVHLVSQSLIARYLSIVKWDKLPRAARPKGAGKGRARVGLQSPGQRSSLGLRPDPAQHYLEHRDIAIQSPEYIIGRLEEKEKQMIQKFSARTSTRFWHILDAHPAFISKIKAQFPTYGILKKSTYSLSTGYTVEAHDRRLEVGLGLVSDERAVRARDEENGERAIAHALAAVRHHALAAAASGMGATAASRGALAVVGLREEAPALATVLQMKLKESEVEQHRGVQEAKIKYEMSMADKCDITYLMMSRVHKRERLPLPY
ncbi:hypothetical protein K438DRAFT_1755345 [Mycena galopus ATCC 62051]|nr:hypothetical protein K438DRAFT_1755345 [Mycena galopus ATCC 62051]